MNSWVEPPPPKEGMGCFAKGCLILGVFAVLLVIAGIAGIYWGMHSQSAMARGIFWLTRIHAVSDTSVPIPEVQASDAEIAEVRARWQTFERSARHGEAAEIELSARDLNLLIASDPDLAGKAQASIDRNRLRFRVSIPLTHFFIGRAGRYLNAEVAIETEGAETLDHLQLNRIIVNDEPLPGDLLDWKLNSRQLREYFSKFTGAYRTGSIEIRDGKLILKSRSWE